MTSEWWVFMEFWFRR